MKRDSNMGIGEKKTLGERIKGNLSKRWQGVKNIFGNKGAQKAKSALEQLRNTAKKQYAALDVKNTNDLSDRILAVWTKLKTALEAVLSMCGEDVDADENGQGRAYAKYILTDDIKDVPDEFDKNTLKDFNDLESQVVNLQLVANKTDRTSAIPSVIKDAAKETSQFYAYAYAYACAGTIHDKMKEINKVLQNEKTLWRQIKRKLTKNGEGFINQWKADSKKVAKAIYNQAKDAKIRGSIKTQGFMTYFKDSFKDLIGLYTEPDVLKEMKKETSDNDILKNKVEEALTNNPKGLSNNLNIQLKDSTDNINDSINKKISSNSKKDDDDEN